MITCYKFTKYDVHERQGSACCNGGHSRDGIEHPTSVIRVREDALQPKSVEAIEHVAFVSNPPCNT
jgi:hypothetical protein